MKALPIATAILAFLAGVAVSVALNPRAGEASKWLNAEIATGQCRYGSSPDGMWWQSDHDHSNRYKTNGCLQFGIAAKINPVWSVGARWITLGSASTNALAVAYPGDDQSKSDPAKDKQRAECAGSFTADCLYRWKGGGGIKGVNFTFAVEAFRKDRFSIEPEIGLFVYQVRWSAQVYPMGCGDGSNSAPCPWRQEVEQKTGYYVSPEIGLTLRYRHLFVGTQYFFRTTQHTPISAGIGGPAQTWIVGVQIPI